MDFSKYQNLHTIIMLKDVIRKWWRSQLSFADHEGNVAEWQRGQIVPPPNDFCRLSLFSPEGLRRCGQSVKVLHEKFRSAPKLRHAMTHDCHLGFTIVGAPLYLNGEYRGFLFVEGFAPQPISGRDAEVLKTKTREVNPGASDLERAVDRIPTMNGAEIEKVIDLLEFAVNEIANFEGELARRDETIQALADGLAERYRFENIVGRSPRMVEIFRLFQKVAHLEATVLLEGEPGTGKELLARAIHYNGPRRDKPFAIQSCTAFDENLLDSALFGHTKGAFPGAVRDKPGLFESADGGTVFLDELDALTPRLQMKLVRLLQEGTFVPLGGSVAREADVRIITATHRDLRERVTSGELREDLYYRVNIIRVQMPPLRDRPDDLPLLVEHFVRKLQRPGQRARGLSSEALAAFAAYPWPGNVRELENELERLLVIGSELELIPIELVSSRIRDAARASIPESSAPLSIAPGPLGNLNEAVEDLERSMIGEGLLRTGNNKSQLARELGISRSNLILKIAKYGLEKPGAEASDAG